MHRFYVCGPVNGAGETVALSPEESAHAARVLRLRPGEAVQLLNGENLYDAELVSVNEQAATVRITALRPSPEPPARVVLLQGLPKADKLELIAQKATELGVWELWPVEMERSVAKADKADRAEKKWERLSRIALEAAKQSGRAHVPHVAPVQSLAGALRSIAGATPGFDAVFVAWEDERALPFSEAVRTFSQQGKALERAAVVIGPEGGISRAEWESLRELGAVSVTLGPRILRTETAGLCALSVIWAALGEM